MDFINTIKVTVEPTNNDSAQKSELPVAVDNSDNPIQESESNDSFSQTLKSEMENNENNQENVNYQSEQEKAKEESGNFLPYEDDSSITDQNKLPLEELVKLDMLDIEDENSEQNINLISNLNMPGLIDYEQDPADNSELKKILTFIQSKPGLIDYGQTPADNSELEKILSFIQSKPGLIDYGQTPADNSELENILTFIQSKSGLFNYGQSQPQPQPQPQPQSQPQSQPQTDRLNEIIETFLQMTKEGKSVESFLESIFGHIISKQQSFANINNPGINQNRVSEILNTMKLNAKEGKKSVVSNLDSLYQGSLTQSNPASYSTNILPGFDLSSNTHQNSSSMQQFSELPMHLFERDKLIHDATFDQTKITQINNNIQNNSSIVETNRSAQIRNISEFMIKTPVMDKQWASEFNNHIVYMSKSGGGNAIIKLNPAHLGPVEASIRVVNEVATIHISATHISTREVMDIAIPRLKDMLQEQGFSQVNVDISDKSLAHNFSPDSDKSNDETLSANSHFTDEQEGDFPDDDSVTVLGKSELNRVVDYFA